jgi:5-(carboxyamino)imidazole ribonucleotide synthase
MRETYPYPLAHIGLIGGGQLGRMLVKAAKRLGCTCTVLDPTANSPAGQLAGQQIEGSFHDADKIRELAAQCDVLTCELEAIDTATLAELEAEGKQIHPSAKVISTLQDKLTQKGFLREHGIPTSDFVGVDKPDLAQCETFGFPLVQKARHGGYDGRGVAILRSTKDFAQHLPVPSLFERFVSAEKEIAVLVARSRNGECAAYPAVEMCVHPEEHVLDVLLSPANINTQVAEQAKQIAIQAVEALQGVGIFGVEMFVTANDKVLINEIAPRTHNSGHQTIEANITDQFEQHLRAILGLPLGSTETLSPAAMVNLLGAPGETGKPVIRGLEQTLAISGVCLHLYGKASTKPFRKMGHITVLAPTIEQAKAKAMQVRDTIEIGAEETL